MDVAFFKQTNKQRNKKNAKEQKRTKYCNLTKLVKVTFIKKQKDIYEQFRLSRIVIHVALSLRFGQDKYAVT